MARGPGLVAAHYTGKLSLTSDHTSHDPGSGQWAANQKPVLGPGTNERPVL